MAAPCARFIKKKRKKKEEEKEANMADLFTMYSCTNCQDEISGIRVHCAQCKNFDLCLQCFAAGAEIGKHQNNHPYQFMDTGTAILSVFRGRGSWAAREDTRLLDAIEKYGFGNWEDVSKHIETKSPEDAKEEYINKFVNGTIGRHTWQPAQKLRSTLTDHTVEDVGPLGSKAMDKLPPLDITAEEAAQLGYMPNCDSFEREYDASAEQLISNMSLNSDDTEADYLLKLAHVDMYTRRLRERIRRKRIVRDYQLVANFFRNRNYAQNPGLSREQKEFRDRFRVFAQFYSSNEYERLLGSLERERELRIRLAELYRYRYNGLTKIDECRHFEQHAAMALPRSTGPYDHGKTDSTLLSIGNHQQPGYFLHSPQQSSRKIEMFDENEASSSSIEPRSMHHIGDPTFCVALSHNRNYSDSWRGTSSATTTTMARATPPLTLIPATMMNATMTKLHSSGHVHPAQPLLKINDVSLFTKAGERHLTIKLESNMDEPQLSPLNVNTRDGSQQQPSPRTHSPPMSNILRTQLDEIKHLPGPLGSEQLSASEQHLCKMFNLPPTTYLSVKTVLLSGAPLAGNLSPLEHTLRKYFIKVGWLSH